MIRRSWRTVLGVMLGVLVSIFIRDLTPSITFPREYVTSFLLGIGFVLPSQVFDSIDFVMLALKPIFLPVLAGAALCVLIAGVNQVKAGLRLGFIVASLVVGLPLLALIFFIFVRGLSFPLLTWFVRVFIQPVAAVSAGMLAGVIAVWLRNLAATTRRRASSSL